MRGTLRGNEGPSSFRGSLVAMAILSGATVGSANNILQMKRACTYSPLSLVTRELHSRDSILDIPFVQSYHKTRT